MNAPHKLGDVKGPRGGEKAGRLERPAKTPAAPKDHGIAPTKADAAGVLTVTCVAPVMVDGGTRFRWSVGVEQAVIDGLPCADMITALRKKPTRAEEERWRDAGGRSIEIPLHPSMLRERTSAAAARVRVAGHRRESITMLIPGECHLRINAETGDVRLQLKARALWAVGYARAAQRWLALASWWFTGDAPPLEGMHAAGWITTGVELCSDFTGLSFGPEDAENFVGFRATELVRRFSRSGALETLNMGTRGSPVSLCIYDKTQQIEDVKGGDDSIYRATHEAHGWDGVSERRRVEFRLSGRALTYQAKGGPRLDLRDPAALADPAVRAAVWGLLCRKKRLVVVDATRIERATIDPRWLAVSDAAEQHEVIDYRQHRVPQNYAWQTARSRAFRDALRSLRRVAALHDVDPRKATVARVARFVAERTTPEQHEVMEEYQDAYRKTRELEVGEEIRDIGAPMWAEVMPTDWESD